MLLLLCYAERGAVKIMSILRELLLKLIEKIPDNQIGEVIDFLTYLKLKRERGIFKDLELASESSLDFWNNDIDDEVWNNV